MCIAVGMFVIFHTPPFRADVPTSSQSRPDETSPERSGRRRPAFQVSSFGFKMAFGLAILHFTLGTFATLGVPVALREAIWRVRLPISVTMTVLAAILARGWHGS